MVHGSNIPGSYAILLFTALDLASITSHIHNWMLCLRWLCLFILSGVISPLISSSILGIYQPGHFIFRCPIFLPFRTVHGVLKARILKWFAIPFSSGPHFVRTPHSMGLHMTHLSWVALHGMAHSFIELDKAAVHVMRFDSLVFCDCDFQSSALWWRRMRDLWKLPDGRLTEGELGLVLIGGAILNKFLIQYSVGGWSYVPCYLLGAKLWWR